MASAFEDFVNDELPKRPSTKHNPLALGAGKIAMSTGVGLELEFKDPTEVALAAQSAYDIAVEGGFVGTKEEWVASLKGEGGNINIIGTLDSEEELDAIETEGLETGTAYFANAHLRVWNGTIWTDSNSLLGPAGLTFLGKWPDAQALPPPVMNDPGDAYIWKSDVWLLLPDPDGWTSIGLKGETGKSSYDVAVDNGFVGTQSQWLATLVGRSNYQIAVANGFEGSEAQWLLTLQGKSAHQVWQDQPGNENGDEAAFLLAIKGNKGDRGIQGLKGDPATPFKVVGSRTAIINLPMPGVESQAYYVGSTLCVWIESTTSWMQIPGAGGQSAYEIAVMGGYQGEIDEWVESLKGDQGIQGIRGIQGLKGEPGTAFRVVGSKLTVEQLPNPGTAGQAWYVGSTLYVWLEDQAEFYAVPGAGGQSAYEIAVVDGFAGTVTEWLTSLIGKSAYQVWLGQPGNADGTEAQFLLSLKGDKGDKGNTVTGPKGDPGANLKILGLVNNEAALTGKPAEDNAAWITQDTGHLFIYILATTTWTDFGPFHGKDGKSIIVKGAVATQAALPADAAEQDAYTVTATGDLFMWINAAWVNLGRFRGTDGKNGTNGTNGINGDPGEDGKSLTIIKVLTEQDQVIPPTVGNDGNAYIDLESTVHICVNGAWVASGKVGVQGDQGPQGVGFILRGTVANVAALPPKAEAAEQDGYLTADNKLLYVLTEGEWTGPFDLTGQQGIPGEQGIEGPAGKSINILGSYDTIQLLQAAHPTGTLGDGYLVVADLVIWTTAAGGQWINIGPVRGPQGIPGIQGVPGPEGKVGPKGEKGTRWLNLPDGMEEPSQGFTGNVGDWAVSKDTLKVYYKSLESGWVFYGWLVAGDVNSPLVSEGKVVRFGANWVKLPVDEVEDPVEDKQYVRVYESVNKTVWAPLVLPDPFDEPTANGKNYLRSRANGQPKGSWVEMPAYVPEAPTTTGKTYLRSGNTTAWVEYVPGLPEAPTADPVKLFMRKGDKTWVEYTPPSVPVGEAPTDGKQYSRKNSAWVPVTIDYYSLPLRKVGVASVVIDAAVEQMITMNNTSGGIKDVSFSTNPGANRGVTVVLIVTGTSGALTYSTGLGGAIKWSGGTPPALTGLKTVITFVWDGVEWLAAQGAVTTS